MKVTSSAIPNTRRRKRVRAWRPDQEPRRALLRLVPPLREADMGIRLVMEATSQHAPEGLTWRERYALIVLAASAIDATRELPLASRTTRRSSPGCASAATSGSPS